GADADQAAQALHMMAGAGLEAVAPQQAAALQPGPGRPQFILGCQGRRDGWQAVRLLLDLLINQKSVSPSGGFAYLKRKAETQKDSLPARRPDKHRLMFHYTPRRRGGKVLHRIWAQLSPTDRKSTRLNSSHV